MSLPQSLTRTVAPTVEPVSLAEAKKHLEIQELDQTHDSAISRMIQAAREQVEKELAVCLVNQTYTLSMRKFPSEDVDKGSIRIDKKPVSSITSITYYDSNNAQQTLGTGVYGLDAERSVVYLKYDQEWPSITEQHDGIVITAVIGYGATAATVPEHAKHQILIQIQEWFDPLQRKGGVEAYDRLYKRFANPDYLHGI